MNIEDGKTIGSIDIMSFFLVALQIDVLHEVSNTRYTKVYVICAEFLPLVCLSDLHPADDI